MVSHHSSDMEPSADQIKEWERVLALAQAHSVTQPPFDPSNRGWQSWQDIQRKLEQAVYAANPWKRK